MSNSFVTLRTVGCQAPLSMLFSRQEYWSGLPYPPPGDLPNPGFKCTSLISPALAGWFFTTSATGKPTYDYLLFFCCSLSRVWLLATPWTAARQAFLSFTVFWSLLKLMSIESVMLYSHLILCHPLLLPSFFSITRVFSSELTVPIRWPKFWSFSISPSNKNSGSISFWNDWFDLLAV